MNSGTSSRRSPFSIRATNEFAFPSRADNCFCVQLCFLRTDLKRSMRIGKIISYLYNVKVGLRHDWLTLQFLIEYNLIKKLTRKTE